MKNEYFNIGDKVKIINNFSTPRRAEDMIMFLYLVSTVEHIADYPPGIPYIKLKDIPKRVLPMEIIRLFDENPVEKYVYTPKEYVDVATLLR